MRSKQSGFTLVEIAIVLVIIGLLLGGVLKGQELINSAKVKNFASDLRGISTFIYAYQDRFRALPGDDARTAVNLPGAPVAATTPAPSAANQCGAACIGNARINGAWDSSTITDESARFWQHVRLAGLASGTTVLPPDATPTDAYYPLNADGGRIGVTGDPVWTGGVWAANFFVCMSGVQGRFVRQLDTTLDDGNSATGTIRVLGAQAGGAMATFAAANFYTVVPADDATLYTVCQAN
jgi:prepilin-type N-terminal cleavage/methylation domain-containing protein